MTDINKHVARYFNFLESEHDATFHRLHAEYSKAMVAGSFHDSMEHNPHHPAHHVDHNARSAARDYEILKGTKELSDAGVGRYTSQAEVDAAKKSAVESHPDVKKHYEKSDANRKHFMDCHKAMWDHIDKHGTPASFESHPDEPNDDVAIKHFNSLKRSAEGK